jgi:nucleotide-binding universal stress UspA family protein
LHVVVDVAAMAGLAGEGLAGAISEEIIAETREESARGPGSVRTLFERAIDEQGVLLAEPKPGQQRATASFTVSTGQEEELVAAQARLADLTVVPHPQATGSAAWVDVLHAVLFNSGRPVLLAPERCPKAIGERICIAWNGTAESASGVAAALPWLKLAKAVRVLTALGYQRRGPSAQELAPYLSLHGVAAELATFQPVNGVVGAGLLAAAAEFGADLLATGAYSHSRFRQRILGGVTRHVLGHARLPVLMSR